MSDAVTEAPDLEVETPENTIQPGQRTADVQILGRKVRLAVPKSKTIAVECVGMMQNSPTRGLAACLTACWQAGGARGGPKANITACNYNIGQWAGKALDELLDRGLRLEELRSVGMVAYNLMIGSLVTEKEVKGAEGFSEAPEGSTG